MYKLCIIPCGSKKIWDLHPAVGVTRAKDVYISAFHKACQRYAEHFFSGQWVILSAKHGFLFPDDDLIHNYNVAFNHKTSQVISTEELREQVVWKGLDTRTEIYVLGGKKYRNVVEQVQHLNKAIKDKPK